MQGLAHRISNIPTTKIKKKQKKQKRKNYRLITGLHITLNDIYSKRENSQFFLGFKNISPLEQKGFKNLQ